MSKHLWVARSWIVCTLPAVSWIFLIFPVVSWIFIILRARSFLFSTWCQNDLEFSTSCTLIYHCFYHSIIKKNSWKHKQVWLARLARLVPCFLIKFALCLYEKGGLLRSWLKQPRISASRPAVFSYKHNTNFMRKQDISLASPVNQASRANRTGLGP